MRGRAQRNYEERLKRHEEELAAIEKRKVEAERQRLEAIEAHKAKVRDEVIELARRRRTAEDIRATVASLRSHPEVATIEGQSKFEAWAVNALAVADDMDPMRDSLVAVLGMFGMPLSTTT